MLNDTKEASKKESLPTFRKGAKTVFRLSLPIVIGNTLNNFADTITFFIIGNLCGTEALGTMGLGFMVNRLVSQNFILGFSAGYDTLGSQAYGKGEYKMCGVYLYRAWIIIQLLIVPTYALVYMSDKVLLLFGVVPRAAELAGRFSRTLVLNNLIFSTYDLINRFLIVQRISKPQMIINAVASSLHPFWVYLIAIRLQLDYLGAGYALAITSATKLISVVVYIRLTPSFKQTLPPPTKHIFLGWMNFLRVAVPSGVMYSLEIVSYIVVCITAGSLGKAELAANQIFSNMLSLIISVPMALGYTACVLVGNLLGARRPVQAQFYAKVNVLFNAIFCAVFVSLFIIFRHQIARLYSNDPEVIAKFMSVIFIVMAEISIDTMQTIFCRILIAMARQSFASVVNFISYFGYMIPISFLLLFKFHMGIGGIWFSLGTSYLWCALAFTYKLLTEDWEKVSAEAAERIERDKLLLKDNSKSTNKDIPLLTIES